MRTSQPRLTRRPSRIFDKEYSVAGFVYIYLDSNPTSSAEIERQSFTSRLCGSFNSMRRDGIYKRYYHPLHQPRNTAIVGNSRHRGASVSRARGRLRSSREPTTCSPRQPTQAPFQVPQIIAVPLLSIREPSVPRTRRRLYHEVKDGG